MLNRPVAQNGNEHQHARPGRHTERLQPNDENLGRPCLLFKKYDLDEAMDL